MIEETEGMREEMERQEGMKEGGRDVERIKGENGDIWERRRWEYHKDYTLNFIFPHYYSHYPISTLISS